MTKWILWLALCFCIPLMAVELPKEQTLSLIKPDAVENNHIGDVISRFEKAGLRIAAAKMVKLNPNQAEQFYAVHKDRSFFSDLIKYISSGPIVALVLEGNNAVAKNRELMGATDPAKADAGSIRKDFAESMTRNAVHGSDSIENAKAEILFFFSPNEVYPRF